MVLDSQARELAAALDALKHAYDETLAALVAALDHRERETAGHSQRVALYAVWLGLHIGLHEEELENLYRGALLHDIGKIGIPDAVLLKPGPFTPEEWDVMQGHARIGAEILSRISFLKPASDVPLAHHEAWDGSGYPAGLRGLAIPLHARIFAIVDSYDAIRTERPYKAAQPHEQAVARLRSAAGQRLDPELVGTFVGVAGDVWDGLAGRTEQGSSFETVLEICRPLRLR
ncbi:MAG: HD-GYP domain-containing protein [Myxococcota bacterium]